MIIYLIYIDEVEVYESLNTLSNSVEWQDILDKNLFIIDELGNEYKWDNSMENEIGSIYNYTLKVVSKNIVLSKLCNNIYIQNNRKQSFRLR